MRGNDLALSRDVPIDLRVITFEVIHFKAVAPSNLEKNLPIRLRFFTDSFGLILFIVYILEPSAWFGL